MRRVSALLHKVTAFFGQVLSGEIKTWFSIKEVFPKVWMISDHGADNIYLIEGDRNALLVDTGLGASDLSSFLHKITLKPLIVINTHGHPDHSGGNYQFEKVFIHPSDIDLAKSFNTPEARQRSLLNQLGENASQMADTVTGKSYKTVYVPVKEGQIFDLGNRRIQVMETPGHTSGGICLLDIENRLLFTGDNNNKLAWLFLEHCSPLHEYLRTLERQLNEIGKFMIMLPGHGEVVPSDFINDQIECVKGILDGSLEGKPYYSFAGEALIATFGEASVAFNPENL